MYRNIQVLLFSFFLVNGFTQIEFLPDFERKVFCDSTEMEFPWLGGINMGLAFTVDVNSDNLDELIILDGFRNASIVLYQDSNLEFPYSDHRFNNSSLVGKFQNWQVLHDLNQDGIVDRIFYDNFGILNQGVFYELGNIENGILNFTNNKTQIEFSNQGDLMPLFANAYSIPELADVDYNGSLDMVLFDGEGSFRQFEISLSNEGLPIFTIVDECFGNIYVDYSPLPILGDGECPKDSLLNNSSLFRKHSNDAALSINPNSNGNPELYVSNAYQNNIVELQENLNGYALSNEYFPDGEFLIKQFPTLSEINIPGELNQHFMCTTVEPFAEESKKVINFFKYDQGQNEFEINSEMTDYFNSNYIDIGTFTRISTFDIDKNGLNDLVFIDNNTESVNDSTTLTCLFHYIENDISAFIKKDVKFDFPIVEFWADLEFFDIDQDGDKDLIQSGLSGQFHLFENTSVNQDLSFELDTSYFQDIDVGSTSSAVFYDVDQDGKFDLISGNQNGRLSYFRNISNGNEFKLELVSDYFGEIDVREIGKAFGYSSPEILSYQGKDYLLVGSKKGVVELYQFIESNIEYVETLELNSGKFTIPSVINLDNSNDNVGLFLSNIGGGVQAFASDQIVTHSDELKYWIDTKMKVFPNPANSDYVNLSSSVFAGKKATLQLVTADGKIALQENIVFNHDGELEINVSQIKKGLYFLRISNSIESASKSIVIH